MNVNGLDANDFKSLDEVRVRANNVQLDYIIEVFCKERIQRTLRKAMEEKKNEF